MHVVQYTALELIITAEPLSLRDMPFLDIMMMMTLHFLSPPYLQDTRSVRYSRRDYLSHRLRGLCIANQHTPEGPRLPQEGQTNHQGNLM